MAEWMISSSVLIVVVLALRFVLKGKLSLRLQYALWGLVLLRLLIPISFGGSAISVENLTKKMASSNPVQAITAAAQTQVPAIRYQWTGEYASDDSSSGEPAGDSAAQTMTKESLSVAEIANLVWLGGMAVIGAWFLLSNLRLHRALRKTRALLDNGRALPVYVSDAAETPCLFGLFRPAVYLTKDAAASDHMTRHAVEHELTHYYHRDHIWAFLRCVCLAVHWYNPLVWCAALCSRNDAELACDEATIKRLGESERAAYGRTLIGLTCEKRPALLNTATTMTGSGRSIRERISLIVKKPKMAAYTAVAVVLIAVLAAGCTFTGAADTGLQQGDNNMQYFFTAKVLEVHEEYLLLEVFDTGNTSLSNGGTLEVSTDVVAAKGCPALTAGECVRVLLARNAEGHPTERLSALSIYKTDETGAILENGAAAVTVYQCGELFAAIPNEYADELIVYTGADTGGENALLRVYGKAVTEAFAAANLGEDDTMGFLFAIVRWDKEQFQNYFTEDHSGLKVFARDDDWYYCCSQFSDSTFYPTGDIADQERWEVLLTELPAAVTDDFIIRNSLTAYEQ